MSTFLGDLFMPQRDNLQLYVDFNNPNCVSGSTWRDLSGNGRNGVVTGSPTYASDSAIFTGSEYATFGNIKHPTESTIMMMLKIGTSALRLNPWNQAYGGHGTWTCEPAGTVSNYFGDSGSNSTPYISCSGGVYDDFTDNVWALFAIARNTTHWQRFKNTGSTVDTSHTYGTLADDNNNIIIGDGYQDRFIGRIGFFALWDKKLTPSEVIAIHDKIASRYTT